MFERKCRREPVPSRDESRRRICRFIGTIENGREDGNETFPVSSSHARNSFFFFFFTILKQPRGISRNDYGISRRISRMKNFVSFQPIAAIRFVYCSRKDYNRESI